MEICPKCGLPIQACVCGEIGKSEQNIKVEVIKRRYGKIITLVSGFIDLDIREIAKEMKQELACGGTVKNGIIKIKSEQSL